MTSVATENTPGSLGRRVRRLGTAVLFCLALPLFSPEATAQSAAADALFRDGVAAAKAGNYAAAIQKLQASYELDPARGTLYALALAEEKAGRFASANGHYSELLDAARRVGDTERVSLAEAKLKALKGRVPHLSVRVPSGENVSVTLDGNKLPAGAFGAALPLDPGEHEIAATRGDGAEFKHKITVTEGQSVSVDIKFSSSQKTANTAPPATTTTPPSAASPPPGGDRAPGATETTGLQTAGWVLAATGVVAGGVGGFFWLRSGSIFDELEDECPGGQCASDPKDKADEGRTAQTIAQIGFIVGGLAVATGLTLVLVGGSSASAADDGFVGAYAGLGHFGLRGAF